jgi:hypothetical protein
LSEPSPVRNKHTLQNPWGASAKTVAPHFAQTLAVFVIAVSVAAFVLLEIPFRVTPATPK